MVHRESERSKSRAACWGGESGWEAGTAAGGLSVSCFSVLRCWKSFVRGLVDGVGIGVELGAPRAEVSARLTPASMLTLCASFTERATFSPDIHAYDELEDQHAGWIVLSSPACRVSRQQTISACVYGPYNYEVRKWAV